MNRKAYKVAKNLREYGVIVGWRLEACLSEQSSSLQKGKARQQEFGRIHHNNKKNYTLLFSKPLSNRVTMNWKAYKVAKNLREYGLIVGKRLEACLSGQYSSL